MSDSLDDIYKVERFDINSVSGNITEKDKFLAAKQILLGIALLYTFTISAYVISPLHSGKLIDICTTVLPPLATLILAAYFREQTS